MKQSGGINIHDLQPGYLKSGSQATENLSSSWGSELAQAREPQEFAKQKAKYDLDATWKEAQLAIVENDEYTNKYLKVIREGKGSRREPLSTSC